MTHVLLCDRLVTFPAPLETATSPPCEEKNSIKADCYECLPSFLSVHIYFHRELPTEVCFKVEIDNEVKPQTQFLWRTDCRGGSILEITHKLIMSWCFQSWVGFVVGVCSAFRFSCDQTWPSWWCVCGAVGFFAVVVNAFYLLSSYHAAAHVQDHNECSPKVVPRVLSSGSE